MPFSNCDMIGKLSNGNRLAIICCCCCCWLLLVGDVDVVELARLLLLLLLLVSSSSMMLKSFLPLLDANLLCLLVPFAVAPTPTPIDRLFDKFGLFAVVVVPRLVDA